MTKNIIGLDQSDSQKLSASLNNLLANYQVFYMNVRGYHWNIKGPAFFELHVKFEEIYNELQTNIDEIAERILTLGAMPEHSFSHYLAVSDIKEHTKATNAQETVTGIVTGFGALIAQQRVILELAGEVSDEGTAAQMSDYIRAQEKHLWMFNAWLQG